MTIKRYSETIPASGKFEFRSNNFFLLVQSSAAINVEVITGGGSREDFAGIIAGLLIRRVKPWEKMQLIGTAGVTFEVWTGDEEVDRDETDVRLQIATISGIIPVTISPSSTLTDSQEVVTNGTANTVAASATRKAICFINDGEISQGTVYIQSVAAGTGKGYPLANGTSVTYAGPTHSGAFDIRNDSGASVTINVQQRS